MSGKLGEQQRVRYVCLQAKELFYEDHHLSPGKNHRIGERNHFWKYYTQNNLYIDVVISLTQKTPHYGSLLLVARILPQGPNFCSFPSKF